MSCVKLAMFVAKPGVINTENSPTSYEPKQ
jgi:hypothetical protein